MDAEEKGEQRLRTSAEERHRRTLQGQKRRRGPRVWTKTSPSIEERHRRTLESQEQPRLTLSEGKGKLSVHCAVTVWEWPTAKTKKGTF